MPLGNDVVDLGEAGSDLAALHPRFLDRVLSARERQAVEACEQPGIALWAHWAAKESAYKALRKVDRSLVFSPPLFEVFLDKAARACRTPRGPGAASTVECERGVGATPEPSDERAIRRDRGAGAECDADDERGSASGLVSIAGGSVLHRGRRLALSIESNDGYVHAIAGLGVDLRSAGTMMTGVLPCPGGEEASRFVRRAALGAIAAAAGVAVVDLAMRGSRPPRCLYAGRESGLDLSLSHHGGWVAYAAIAESPSLDPTFNPAGSSLRQRRHRQARQPRPSTAATGP